MKKILILTTGGTIASTPAECGLSPASDALFQGFHLDEAIKTIYPMGEFCDLQNRRIELKWKEICNLDSSNIAPCHWKLIASGIQEGMADASVHGIVITHGTDTLAYTAAGIRYLLEDVHKPVVFTGAQLPFDAPKTDAKKNLVDAVLVACSDFSGLSIVFGGKILDGFHAKKVYAKQVAAFESINCEDLGYLDANGTIVWKKKTDTNVLMRVEKKEMQIKTCLSDTKIACIRLIPGETAEVIDLLVNAGYKGIVLEAFGCGGVPTEYGEYLRAIKNAADHQVVVCIISQCTYDGTDLSVYEVGALAKKAGAISAGHMTIEALSAKLRWVFGQTDDYEEALRLIQLNNI